MTRSRRWWILFCNTIYVLCWLFQFKEQRENLYFYTWIRCWINYSTKSYMYDLYFLSFYKIFQGSLLCLCCRINNTHIVKFIIMVRILWSIVILCWAHIPIPRDRSCSSEVSLLQWDPSTADGSTYLIWHRFYSACPSSHSSLVYLGFLFPPSLKLEILCMLEWKTILRG